MKFPSRDSFVSEAHITSVSGSRHRILTAKSDSQRGFRLFARNSTKKIYFLNDLVTFVLESRKSIRDSNGIVETLQKHQRAIKYDKKCFNYHKIGFQDHYLLNSCHVLRKTSLKYYSWWNCYVIRIFASSFLFSTIQSKDYWTFRVFKLDSQPFLRHIYIHIYI